jgi:NitT/TauT family transport system substrate-binding protein
MKVTAGGKAALIISILALAGFGAWRFWERMAPKPAAETNLVEVDSSPPSSDEAAANKLNSAVATNSAPKAEPEIKIPKLPLADTYKPKDNIVEIEISEYAGYAGLIVANGGLEPTEHSEFFKKGGFKVKFIRNEVESRAELNAGKLAALATTVDVLPIYGHQFEVVVPAQISFSRGADGVVVRREIKSINDLKGRVLATARFTEGDFFIRFLAQEAALGIHVLSGISERPAPGVVNLVYSKDAFSAGDLFLKDSLEGSRLLAGCVTWAPKTTEIANQLKGQADILVTSLNLLLVADILAVNRGFARQHPEKVAVLVAGLLEGNRKVQAEPDSCLDIVGKAFGWDREQTKAELAKVHLSNLPENKAFFSGFLDSAGTFTDIYEAAAKAYGRPLDGKQFHFVDSQALTAAEHSGAFKGQEIAIDPIRPGNSALAQAPLLSKDIRFLFEPNTFILPIAQKANQNNLAALKQMLQISPGSTVLLRGHVDNARLEEFRQKGGENFVALMAQKASELSKNRALEIRRLLVERYDIAPARVDTVGLGWDEPAGKDNEQNRRVEALWFTVR